MRWLIAIALGYLAGSIPFGLLLGWAKGVDIREQGSGNVGATNCGRVLGKKFGVACFVFDVLKGTLPVLLAGWAMGVLGDTQPAAADVIGWLLVAVAAVIAHVFPVWLKFKGGKGVATGFGVILGLWPVMTVPALLAGLTWIALAAWKRYVSLASIVAAGLLPVYLIAAAMIRGWDMTRIWPFLAVAILMAVVVVLRHRTNIARLREGTEPKLGGGEKPRKSDKGT